MAHEVARAASARASRASFNSVGVDFTSARPVQQLAESSEELPTVGVVSSGHRNMGTVRLAIR